MALVVIGLSSPISRASAAEVTDAETLIRQGMDLRRDGKDERALPFFQRAYALEPTPRSAGQLGLAEMAVGYWVRSESHLAEALESPTHPWIAKNHQTLSGALAQVRKHIGEVVVAGEPRGARVQINGHDAGALPLPEPMRVSEGRVQIDLSAPGFAPGAQTIHVAGGGKETVTIKLSAEEGKSALGPEVRATATATSGAAAAVAPPGDPTPDVRAGVAPLPGRPLAAEGSPANEGSPDKAARPGPLAFVTGGLALASIVFAVVETVRWQSKQSDFNNRIGDPSMPSVHCGTDDPQRGPAGCQQLYEDGQSAWKLSLLGYGLGGVLAAGSVYLFLASGSHDGTSPGGTRQSLICAPDLRGSGVACGIRF